MPNLKLHFGAENKANVGAKKRAYSKSIQSSKSCNELFAIHLLSRARFTIAEAVRKMQLTIDLKQKCH